MFQPYENKQESGEGSTHARILETVRRIPPGRVASYGLIARVAGLPGRARLVGRILAQAQDPALPWHRVVAADGRLALHHATDQQVRRLGEEGVDVRGGRVSMARHRWQPSGDAPLLD